ncbi:cellulose binding domain-containing protein [Litchfieldella rifensis]|uniref:Cellulose binding domain-containing protein n=1 Tax=Litchfieldella rifensis TaxID=762643 RepID=A0ABV7LIP1_9GAMM
MSNHNGIIDVSISTTATELEELIGSAPQNTILKLEAGHYVFDDAITIARSDISLVGAGSGQTTLTFSNAALDRNDDYGIRVDGSENETIGSLQSALDEGERLLTLGQDHGLKPGDSVRLWQDNDDAFFEEIGDTSWRKQQYAELRTSMAKVAAVDGGTVTLDRGVHFGFDAGKTQVERLDTVNGVTLEGFSIGFELGIPDKATFENTLDELTGYQAVSLDGTVDSRLSDIQVVNGPSKAFHIARSLDSVVDGIEAHGAFNKGSGGNGYAYELRESYDGTFTGLEDTGMRHGLLFASWRSSVGNDIEVASTDRDINFHGGRDHGNSVHVLESIRDPEADEMSTTLWVNSGGESFGAITDASANQVSFDYVIGSRRDDTLQGSDDGVYLDGGLGHDHLTGGVGDDILQGGPGNHGYDGDDVLDGGDGNDTALYLQSYDAFDIVIAEDGEVTIRGESGTDTLVNMERAVFADGTHLDLGTGEVTSGEPMSIPTPADILGDSTTTTTEESTTTSGDSTTTTEDSTQTEAEADITITGNVTSEWSSGYVAEIFVENTSESDIVDPVASFSLPADIDTLWNGELSESDGGYQVSDDESNTLTPGEVWRFSYKAYGEDQSLPETVAVRGADGQDLEVQLLGMNGTQVDDVPA